MSYDVEAGIFINEQDFAKYNKKIISIINKSHITKFDKVEQVKLGNLTLMHYSISSKYCLDEEIFIKVGSLDIQTFCYFAIEGYHCRTSNQEFDPGTKKEMLRIIEKYFSK